MSCLDPKVDMVFKRIFGAHKDLAIDFLNAMLPLERPIEELEYVTAETASEWDGVRMTSAAFEELDFRVLSPEGFYAETEG